MCIHTDIKAATVRDSRTSEIRVSQGFAQTPLRDLAGCAPLAGGMRCFGNFIPFSGVKSISVPILDASNPFKSIKIIRNHQHPHLRA